jgi:hypothetical protein
MGKSARQTLLPGVSTFGGTPDVVFQSRRVVASARRRAAIRDAFDFLLLGCVDGLFLRWPQAHLPLLDRSATMILLASVNVLLLLWIWSARSYPLWRARRVAATWNTMERNQWINRLPH